MKYVFYHIPKTGGTTLTAFIDQHFDLNEICPRAVFLPSTIWLNTPPSGLKRELSRYKLYRDHFFFNVEKTLGIRAKTFTLFRDPVQRVLSQFYFYRNYSDFDIEKDLRNGRMTEAAAQTMCSMRSMSFYDFIEAGPFAFKRSFENTQACMLAGGRNSGKPGEFILDQAQKRLTQMNVFGMLELFEPFLQMLCYEFNWVYPGSIQRLNQTVYPEKSESMSEQAKTMLEKWVGVDRKLYAFAQRLFLQRYRSMIVRLLSGHFDRKEIEAASANPFIPRVQVWIEQLLRANPKASLLRRKKEYKASCQQGSQSIRLTMADALFGSGWLEREGGLNESVLCRWTGPGHESSAEFMISKSGFFLMQISVLETLDAGILRGLEIFVNGKPLSIRQEPAFERGARISALILPDMIAASGHLQLTLKVPKTLSHSQFNGESDKRQKGLRISEISLTPVEKQNIKKLGEWQL